MLTRNCSLILILIVASLIIGGASAFSITKENPSSPNLGGYKNIYVGWPDLREDDWKLYGYDLKDIWVTEIKRHNVDGLQLHLKGDLPGKTITGAKSKSEVFSGQGDLYLKFIYNRLETEGGLTAIDKFFVDVDFIDSKTGKAWYTASIITTSAVWGPRNWKATTFDGRLDNEIYNLSGGIAEKFK